MCICVCFCVCVCLCVCIYVYVFSMKLYIGGLPSNADDSMIADMLSVYGGVESVSLSRDPVSLKCVGFGFAKMTDEASCLKAISALHNKCVLEPELFPNVGPMQLRILRDVVTATSSKPVKLFIGGVPGTATGKMIRTMFEPYGELLDVFISPEKGYAFVKYGNIEDATAAVDGVNGVALPNSVRPLEVRFAQSTKGMEGDAPSEPRGPKGDWAEYVSVENNNRVYYHNRRTGETTWDIPSGYSAALQSNSIPPTPSIGAKGPPGSNIFVYGIPETWGEADFVNEFSKHGKIISSKIVYDKATGTHKGYGFISYTSKDAADNAVETLNGTQLIPGGKRLKVQIKKGDTSLMH